MLRWITLARSWNLPARIGIATIAVAATTALQLPADGDFPGQPFLLYFVAVLASASALGRTAGFVAVAETCILSLLFQEPVYSLKLTRSIDLLGIEIYAAVAALSVEAFCRLVDSALVADIQCKEVEGRLADREVQLGLTRNSEARFRATFDHAAVGIAHIAPDGRWLRVNGALCRMLGYPVDELLTRSLQDVTYPDDLAADLARVQLVREGKIDSYETEKRLLRKDGLIIWANKSVGCVRKSDGSIDYFVSTIEDISARKQAEKDLRENEEHFRSSLLHCPLPILLFDDREQILAISQSWLEQSGYLREELRRLEDWTIRAYGKHSEEVLEQMRQIIITSTEPEARSAELMIHTKDGRERLWSFVFSPLAVQTGARRLFVCVAQDVTDQKAHEEHIHLLMSEINHRAKNMLSLVQAIARQTAAHEAEEFIERFTERIQALAANQDLLVRNEWQGVDVEDLVRAQLAHFADLVGSRVTVHGSPARLNATAAQAIGLALHELATNAGKYGALSVDAGRVDVCWRLDSDVFAMTWTECNGPPVSPPEQRGFGSTVVDSMVKQTLGGEVQLDYLPSGVVWRQTCPAANALEQNARYKNLERSTQPALAPACNPVPRQLPAPTLH
ncbi:MAG TPA: PAS domain S-box protein [Xanthobacteraceae bacterium]|nr:PAS domain S-box protein [Xanthobacteraceae bacterium]